MEAIFEILGYLFQIIGAIGSGLINGVIQNPIVLVIFIPLGITIAIRCLFGRH